MVVLSNSNLFASVICFLYRRGPSKTATKQFIVIAQKPHHTTSHELSTVEIPNRKEITFAFKNVVFPFTWHQSLKTLFMFETIKYIREWGYQWWGEGFY
jgi:hypothetical protein